MIHIFRFVINTIVLYLIAKYVPGFNHGIHVTTAIIVAVIFGFVNALIGPILRLVAWPINWLTHGLFGIVINYILFAITYFVSPGFQNPAELNPWLASLYGSIIMMLVGTVIEEMWRSPQEHVPRANF